MLFSGLFFPLLNMFVLRKLELHAISYETWSSGHDSANDYNMVLSICLRLSSCEPKALAMETSRPRLVHTYK